MNEIVERTELLVPGPAEGLSALLDVPLPDLAGGEGLPLLYPAGTTVLPQSASARASASTSRSSL
jgi:hypothetical protein